MKNVVLGLCAAALCSAVLFGRDDKVHVTVTGCVNQGSTPSTFVLTNVSERSPQGTVPARVIYWLSPAKQLNGQDGRMVEVTGTYSPSRDAGKTGTIKVESDRQTGDAKIELEHGSRKAEATSNLPVGTSGVKVEQTRPYRYLDVETIKTISNNCR